MSLTSYRTAPPRVKIGFAAPLQRQCWRRNSSSWCLVIVVSAACVYLRHRLLARPGGDLLSRALRRSTIGAKGLHGRVRDGIGCGPLAIATRSCKQADFVAVREVARAALAAARDGSTPNAWACDQTNRAISTGQLHALPHFHTRPINVVVFHGSHARPGFEGGFPLRCFQRLSRPHLATRLCRWRDNRSTRGASTPVLSY